MTSRTRRGRSLGLTGPLPGGPRHWPPAATPRASACPALSSGQRAAAVLARHCAAGACYPACREEAST
jgi:hypothetical protein